ncbi:unnamed protein product [Symbiodinium sp. KB8]|nr:unnamed protein product [Symbiodinium sp. KB8]
MASGKRTAATLTKAVGILAPAKEAKPNLPVFPAYDAIPGDASGITEIRETRSLAGQKTNQSLVQLAQAAVNHTRKLDAKAVRLEKDLKAKQQFWLRYVAGMRQSYRNERARHVQDCARLEAELREAVEQQQAAHQQLGAIVPQIQMASEEPDDWDQVMTVIEPERAEGTNPLQELGKTSTGHSYYPASSTAFWGKRDTAFHGSGGGTETAERNEQPRKTIKEASKGTGTAQDAQTGKSLGSKLEEELPGNPGVDKIPVNIVDDDIDELDEAAIFGDVFRFQPPNSVCCPRPFLGNMLGLFDQWPTAPHTIPRESISHKWYVMRSHVTRMVEHVGSDKTELQIAAAEATHSNVEDLRFAHPKADSPLHNLVHRGLQMTGVLAATPKSESGRNTGVFVFVDPRPLGLLPTFEVVPAGILPISRILDFLGFVPPLGYCCKITGVPSTEDLITVSEDCTVELQLTPTSSVARPRSLSAPPATGDRSLASYGLDATTLTAGTNPTQDLPTVFQREAPGTPDPEDTLTIEAPGESDDEGGVAEVLVSAGFLIFVPRFQVERIRIDLWTPSTLDVVLPELADIRDTDTAVPFNQLLPVIPQPDRAFGSILAVPEWDHFHAHVLIDARGTDGRMFAYAIRGRLNKTSLLLHLGLASRQDLDVFLHGRALDQVSWYTFLSGDLVQISPHGAQPPDPVALEDMLRHREGWDTLCPHFNGPHPLAFFVLSDGGHSTIVVDPDQVRSSADFREEAARVFKYRNKVAVYPSMPQIDDLAVLGQQCKTALVATEKVLRFPIPPGRLPRRHVLLLDARFLLRDITWITADNGLIAVQTIADHFQEYTPPGYCVNVTGAPTESHDGRSFLRAAQGTLLRLTFVQDAPGSTSSSEIGESTTTSAGAFLLGSTPDGDDSEHTEPVDNGFEPRHLTSSARSRSPRRQGNSQGIWVAGLALAQVILATQVQATEGYCTHSHLAAADVLDMHAGLLDSKLFDLFLGIVGAGICLLFGWLAALPGLRPRMHKLLQEPQGSNDTERTNLEALRSFARTLGGPWMPRLPFDLQHLLAQDADADEETDGRVQEELCSIPSLILAFDFTPDAFLLEMVLPATPEELVEALQAGRSASHRTYLPSLLPVLPQPLAGTAVLVAAPNWHPMGHGICFDLTRVDNRLYVTFVPEYVDAAELLQIADLPTALDFAVWVGPDLHRLQPDERIHTFPGMLVQFVPEEVEPDVAFSLGQLLLLRHFWNTTVTVPTPDFGLAYCLAYQGQGQLFIPDPGSPTRYRQHIAEITGASLPHMRLFASRPRPQNAAINGVPCRTVLAIGDRQGTLGPAWHMILFDCRFLEMGWCAAYAVNGRLDIGGVLDDFNNVAPLGWHAVVLGAHPQTGIIQARAGQVFVLAFHANADPAAVPVDADSVTLQGSEDPQQEPTGDSDEVNETPEITVSPAALTQDIDDGSSSFHFLLLAPEYTNEHLSIQLAQPVTVEAMLRAIDASRDAAGRHRFPRVVPVLLQPALPFACLITVPEWETIGLPILVVCHAPPFRVFSAVVPALLQAGDILNLANEHDRDAQVFHRDMPWALPHDQWLQISAGDLFTLLPANQPFIPPLPLATVLSSPVGGWDDPVLPGPFQAGVWLLAELANQRFVNTTHPAETLRTAVARSLHLDTAAMTFVPTTPAIRDHARHGLPSDHVYFALPAGLLPGVVYAVDQRPLLLELVWAFAPGGRVDVAALCARVAHRCPPTHCVRVLGGYAPHQTANHQRYVHPGQVITLRFDRRWSRPAVDPGSESESESDSDQDHDAHGPADDHDVPDVISQSTASASTQPDAGTGSTRRNTIPGSSLDAFAEGNLCLTPTPTLFAESEPHKSAGVYATAAIVVQWTVITILALLVGGLALCAVAGAPEGSCESLPTIQPGADGKDPVEPGPAAWAFAVWIVAAGTPFFLGGALGYRLGFMLGFSMRRVEDTGSEVTFDYTVASYNINSMFDPTVTPEQRAKFEQALALQPPIGWDVPVDHHCILWARQMQTAAALIQPVSASQPTQAYLQDATLDLVHRRASLRTYMRDEEVELRRRRLLVAFAALRLHAQHRSFTTTGLNAAASWLQDIDISLAQAWKLFDECTVAIRAAVRRDRIGYLEGLQAQVTLQDLKNPKALYASVRRAFPSARASRRRHFQPLPAVQLEDGTLASTRRERNDRWIRHFSAQEGGQVVTATQYTDAVQRPDITVLPHGPVLCIQDIPTLAELEQVILGLKPGKAAGPDGLTAEVFRADAARSARALFPLSLKTALGAREPSDWRGGMLMTLAKKASAALDCSAFRSILLENVAAKINHRILRQRLLPAFADYRCDTQAGQVPGIGVENIGLLVKAYQGWATSRHRVSALAFFDLRTAFYRVIRQALMPADSDHADTRDRRFLELLHDLGVPAQGLAELVDHLTNMSVLQEASVSASNVARVADLFRGSWFRLQQDSVLVLTRRGSRPGDPLADLLFAFSFTALCKSIEGKLQLAGLATPVPRLASAPPWHTWQEVDAIGLPAWADDFALLQSHTQPVPLCHGIVRSLEIVATATTAAGMVLAYGEDKTAVLLSSACPRTLPGLITEDEQGQPRIRIHNAITQDSSWVPVVSSYKHLGTVTVANSTPDAEIRYRYAQAQALLKPLRKRLFSAAVIPLALRRMLLRSLIMSKFVFASCTLTLTARMHRRTWCRLYVSLWRGLCRRTSETKQQHSFEVLRQAQATSPLLALAQARATFFIRVLRTGPAALLHMLFAHWEASPSTAWLQQFQLDIQAVAAYVPGVQVLLSANQPVLELVESLQQEPFWWPRQIRAAISAYAGELDQWAQQTPAAVPAPTPSAEQGAFRCHVCNSTFRLRKHLGAHQAKAHGLYSPVRRFAPLPYCGACMRWFHTVQRVQNHLKHSSACLVRLLHVSPPMTMEQVRDAEADDTSRRKKVAKGSWTHFRPAEPPLPVCGPRQPIFAEAIAGLDEDELTVGRLTRLFRPHPADVSWLMTYVSDSSTEGPRALAVDFWLLPPSRHLQEAPQATDHPVSPFL